MRVLWGAERAEARFCVRCGSWLGARCATCGADIPAGAAAALVRQPVAAEAAPEERKVATAVFVDLADSTSLGERLDPERVRSILQDYFLLVAATTAAWGGTSRSTSATPRRALRRPRLHENDPARALSAAAEIVARFTDSPRRSSAATASSSPSASGSTRARSSPPARSIPTGRWSPATRSTSPRGSDRGGPEPVLVGDRTFQATRPLFRFGDRWSSG